MNECTIDNKGNAFYKHIIPIYESQSFGLILCNDPTCECKKRKWFQYPPYKQSESNIEDMQMVIYEEY